MKHVLASKLTKQLKPTVNWNTAWSGIGRPQEETQNCVWNAKSKSVFVTSPIRGSPKQHLAIGTQARLHHGVLSMDQTCPSGFRKVWFTAVLWSFPHQGWNLKHVWWGASKSITGLCYPNTDILLVQHTRPRNSKYDVFGFGTPAASSWVYLVSSWLIFHYFPTNTETEAKEESTAGCSQSMLWLHVVACTAAGVENSLGKDVQLCSVLHCNVWWESAQVLFFLLAQLCTGL